MCYKMLNASMLLSMFTRLAGSRFYNCKVIGNQALRLIIS
nr:MAG TPA: hypothetical protein [Caudoviricetes sp.]